MSKSKFVPYRIFKSFSCTAFTDTDSGLFSAHTKTLRDSPKDVAEEIFILDGEEGIVHVAGIG